MLEIRYVLERQYLSLTMDTQPQERFVYIHDESPIKLKIDLLTDGLTMLDCLVETNDLEDIHQLLKMV
jgi:hypothetical protein